MSVSRMTVTRDRCSGLTIILITDIRLLFAHVFLGGLSWLQGIVELGLLGPGDNMDFL